MHPHYYPISKSRPYLTVYFTTAADMRKGAPARLGHACTHAQAACAAARRLLARDFAAAQVWSPSRGQLTRLVVTETGINITGELP